MLPQLRQYPISVALRHTVEVWLLVTACGADMHWLRRQLDAGALAAARAQAQASSLQTQALVDREQADAERSRSVTAELAERARLQAIEEQSASVHQVSQSVRQTASQVSTMADGIQALERISRVS